MSRECRRCHYALEDFINNDVFACLDSEGLSSRRCFSVDRGDYNYEQDLYGIIKPGKEPGVPGGLDLTLAGDAEELEEEDDGYNYGGLRA